MTDMTVSYYHTGLKEGIVQVVEHLLPKLPYRSLAAALWSLGELPLSDEDTFLPGSPITLVNWILQYCQPVEVCWSNIDTEYPDIEGYLTSQGHDHSVQPGEVIALVRQDLPSENGVYVYTGDGTPLLNRNTFNH